MILFLAVLASSDGNAPLSAQDLQRGIQNYSDVMNGRKKLEQLTPQERQEVLIIFRRVQSQRNPSGQSEECREARANAESAASELAGYARRLQQCATNQDYSEDCSSEFQRVRDAFDDYESAVVTYRAIANEIREMKFMVKGCIVAVLLLCGVITAPGRVFL